MYKLLKRTFQTIILVWFGFTNTNCSHSNNKNKLKSTVPITKIEGDWYNEVSRNMGGFPITASTRLSIWSTDSSNLYSVSTTVVDQMYGGQPKTEYLTGRLDLVPEDGNWKFRTGDYGNRGGYIIIPSDKWENNRPNEITIEFTSGRGNPMTFKKITNL